MGIVASLGVSAAECAACAACCGITQCVSWGLSKCARIGHVLLAVGAFATALVLGANYDGLKLYEIPDVDLEAGCNDSYADDCVRNQMVYRASMIMTILFAALALLSATAACFDKGLWVAKVVGVAVSLLISLWVDNSIFSGFSTFARGVSFCWLLGQSLLFIEIAFEAHEWLLLKADSVERARPGTGRNVLLGYLAFCFALLVAGFVGIVMLFERHACPLGNFFTSVTLIAGVLATAFSMRGSVNGGLLTPSFIFAYTVYLTWSALQSNGDAQCNPIAAVGDAHAADRDASGVLATLMLVASVLWCAWHGAAVLSIFNASGASGIFHSAEFYGDAQEPLVDGAKAPVQADVDAEDVGEGGAGAAGCCCAPEGGEAEESGGARRERTFFHAILCLGCTQLALTLTDFASPKGEPVGEPAARQLFAINMWATIVAVWFVYAFYFRCLYVLWQDNKAEAVLGFNAEANSRTL